MALLLITSCRKETKELRSRVYALRPYNGSALTGQVTFIETAHSDTTIVKLEAQGLVANTTYLSHLHTGTPGNLTGTLIYFHHVMSVTGNVVTEEKWAETYDNALVSNTCFTIHNPAFFSNDTIGYELAGGTGANAQ